MSKINTHKKSNTIKGEQICVDSQAMSQYEIGYSNGGSLLQF